MTKSYPETSKEVDEGPEGPHKARPKALAAHILLIFVRTSIWPLPAVGKTCPNYNLAYSHF